MKATETTDPCSGLPAGEGGWAAMNLGLSSNAMEIQVWHAASKPSSPAGQAGAGVGAHLHSTTSCQPPSPASKLARGRRGDLIDPSRNYRARLRPLGLPQGRLDRQPPSQVGLAFENRAMVL